MRSKAFVAILATLVAAPTLTPSPVFAQDRRDDTYCGNDRNYYQNCKHSNGTTGTIAGGVGGAVIGHALGGGTIGTLAGAGGGALLGRHLDKKHDEAQNRKNGC
jgi:uncharacterized protein YcfJ